MCVFFNRQEKTTSSVAWSTRNDFKIMGRVMFLLSFRYTLPIIVISTIIGTANFAQETFPKGVRPFVPAVIG